jgi:hypothetical protein
MPQTLPVVCEAYMEDENEEDITRLVDVATNHDKNKVMAKLHGMNLNKRDEIIISLDKPGEFLRCLK